MQRKIIITADGSKTIQLEDLKEQYHSIHGAIQESMHVFIKHGFGFMCHSEEFMLNVVDERSQSKVEVSEEPQKSNNSTISILEIGFGTGLNALVTYLEAEKINQTIDYVGVEAYPISLDEINQLNYSEQLLVDDSVFSKMHAISWEEKHTLSSYFSITKQKKFFKEIEETNAYNLIYFDAFGARVQPELWTEQIFQKMFNALKTNGILVTYSAKGSVKRAMQSVGFKVEKLPGPPGKREMIRAIKSL